MTLVTYSESEESDTSPAPVLKAAKDKHTTNTSFRKFVSLDGHKVKVGLTSSQQNSGRTDHAAVDPPSPKKRRLDVPASSKGFNSLLPPPKHVNKKPTSLEKRVSQQHVGSSFSLKTASEPAFDRKILRSNAASEEETIGLSEGVIESGFTKTAETLDTANKVAENRPEVVLSSKVTIFKPLSVARKPPSKRKTANVVKKRSETDLPSEHKNSNESNLIIESRKTPLFSMDNTDANAIHDTASLDYIENLSGEQPDQKKFNEGTGMTTGPTSHGSDIGNSLNRAEMSKNSLLAIAEDLNLPESAKRQLLGRNRSKNSHISDLSAVNIVSFNTDHEYAANEELRAAGETIQHNPVRSIAPGKHSLRQLVSSATTQKDALEEHFASGRRNRKEAGGKYGW